MTFARNLRREATHPEKIVWNELRGRKFLGLKFRRQHVLRGFVVDFYCAELKLAIEIDGKAHDRQKNYDDIRQELIEFKDISFIRISARDVLRSPQVLLERIEKHLKRERPPHPPPPLSMKTWRGGGHFEPSLLHLLVEKG